MIRVSVEHGVGAKRSLEGVAVTAFVFKKVKKRAVLLAWKSFDFLEEAELWSSVFEENTAKAGATAGTYFANGTYEDLPSPKIMAEWTEFMGKHFRA
jgi:hypothetical protein